MCRQKLEDAYDYDARCPLCRAGRQHTTSEHLRQVHAAQRQQSRQREQERAHRQEVRT